MTHFEALQTDKALSASERAIEIFERLGDERSSSVAGTRCQNLMVKGKQAEARELLEEIRLNPSQLKDPEVFKNVLWSCGWYFMLMRDPREAIRMYRLGLARKDLTPFQRAQILEFQASAEVQAGNLKEAKAIAGETKVNRAFRSGIAFFKGDWNSAIELLQEELDWARNANSRWNEINTLALLTDTLRIAGDLDGAMSCFERTRLVNGSDNQYWEMRLRPQAVFVLVDAGRPEAALEHLLCCATILAQGENWLGCAGRVRRAEAMVAAAIGNFREADRDFKAALQISKQYCTPWEEAETFHYWGRALAAAREHAHASEKFDAAIDIYRRHGAGQRWIDRVEGDRLSGSSASAPRANKDSRAIFRREGEYWTLEYQGASSRLRDSKGLQIIAMLIGKPGCELRASDLAGPMPAPQSLDDRRAGNVAGNLGDAGAVLDDRAKSQYRMRLKELRAELEEAEGNNDLGRAESVRSELEAIENQLASALGLGGRDRKSQAHSERARWMVTNSIKRAIAKIDQVNAPLGRHLHSCVRTGNFCSYTPDPDHPVTWRL